MPNVRRKRREFFWCCSLILLSCAPHLFAAEEAPFVAGFDRFSRHSEISSDLSGTLLVTELNCTSCHHAGEPELIPKGGPDLSAAGSRLSVGWMKEFLAAPNLAKPGATMPDMLHAWGEADKSAAIDALVAFLTSMQSPFPEIKATGAIPVQHEFWLKGNVENGSRLYHAIGCVACHAPADEYETQAVADSSLDKLLDQLDPEELKELGLSGMARPVNSVPHGDLKQKYSRLSLSHFLHDPERVRPGGRMPNLKLLPSEAADIAAYLLQGKSDEADSAETIVDAELVARGRTLFSELGCVQCHSLKGIEAKPIAKPFAELDWAAAVSCLQSPAKSQPKYVFDADQKTAFAASSAEVDSLQLRLLQLNCYGCHERNELGGIGRNRREFFETVGHVDIGDEGRFPPTLTHVGFKLTPKWFATVLSGKGDLRKHMTIRMPIFPKKETDALSGQFAKADKADGRNEQQVFGDLKNLTTSGRQLLNTGCIQCHPLRTESLASVVGTDLDGVHHRVRPAWFKQFLLNPIDLKKRTRMPTFFPNGVSSNPAILNGEVDRQIAAIWVYLKDNQKHPLPEKILQARAQNFELVPEDRPIVLRTFMEKAGTHAIAVGFPEKINVAFDSEKSRFAEAWKGKFLDAHGTWFDRFTPLAEPLGTERIEFPQGFPFAVLQDQSDNWPEVSTGQVRFRGYRIDKAGVPTFRYEFGAWLIEDRLAPDSSAGLKRTLSVTRNAAKRSVDGSLWLKVLDGDSVEGNGPLQLANDRGLQVEISTDSAGNIVPVIRTSGHTQQAILELKQPQQLKLELQYQW